MRKRLLKSLLLLGIFISFTGIVDAQDSIKATQPTTRTSVPKKHTSNRSSVALQDTLTTQQPVDNTLKGQYEDLLKRSWTQQGYKVINPSRLSNLWNNITDSISTERDQAKTAKLKVTEQTKIINDLRRKDSLSQAIIQQRTDNANRTEVLGMSIAFATYNWIIWSMILVLAIALTIVLLSTGKKVSEAKLHQQQYNEISREFHEYKTKSKDKEQKLARELQTERNTIEELQAKIKGT